MSWLLRLIEDTLAADAAPLRLPACPRVIYVVHGALTCGGAMLQDNAALQASGEATLMPGESGVTLWRWELVRRGTPPALYAGARHRSLEKLAAPIEQLPARELLMRGDSVAFPPGGCAFLHTHRGPGIRCLIEGGMRIDTAGHSTAYGPGAAWFEAGPEPVFAQAAADRPTRFIRCLVLPRELIGKGSIRYEREEDLAKPKSQRYQVFVDAPIEL
jgi:hypothetical protein